ncbi:DNA-entry nuclease [Lacticaseibacillus paracasei subsp. paracasei Lpp41]|uniref:DNA-entry nuclease n=1 Tax=Lacticaseibacillus paracasei subsp. paracasei Lpp41 TaxID=1256208 RepID=A0A829H8U7_LACPA|nr:DNA-entry nuclease [Lacticaseibacillus paracasei subsp. paracasei Lpp41]
MTDANALLNKSLMPTTKREPLTWNPTGWHNKKTAHGWLYNRSHLIGYQLTGENNNPKNLMTGTQTLNTPLMLAHEMDIAYYLKQSTGHYVRYEVKPIFRGNELVARGVQMRAQSIGDNQVYFNVYIFNIEPGYTINYADGTSTKN